MNDNHHFTPPGAPLPVGRSGSREAPPRAASKVPCAVTLSLDDASGLVVADLTPREGVSALSVDTLRRQLSEAGYGDFYAPDETLEAIVQQANNGRAGQLVAGERRDARMDWNVSRDRTTVELTLHPAWGGQRITERMLADALEAKGIPQVCWLRKALGRALHEGRAEARVVARAVPPVHGEDARFQSLVAREEDLRLTEDARGRVDLLQLHEFVVVEPGTPLLRRLPATEGLAGIDVQGEPLKPEPGRERSFDAACDGAEPDSEDPDLLRATIRGHPVFSAHGVKVDPTLRLKEVGVASGNIDFDGSVEVAGDVTSGFIVKATGDVFIRGMVEKADVSAGGSLTIQGGVAGEEVAGRHDGELRLRTRLSCGGTLSAKFINLADVRARGDIQVREYILQSHVRAGRDLFLGQPSGKGSLIGGWAHADRAVVVNRLGSEAGVATEVTAGHPPRKRRLLSDLKQALTLCEHNWHKVSETLDCIDNGQTKAPDDEKFQRLCVTRDALRSRRQRLQRLIERLAARRQSSDASRVEVRHQQCSNVSLTVDGVRRYFNTDYGPSRWERSGAELIRAQ